jgi:hypothetical protein
MLIFGPFLELLLWPHRKFVHPVLFLVLTFLLTIETLNNGRRNFSQRFLSYGFLAVLFLSAIYNTINSQNIDRSTWSLFVISAVFMNYNSNPRHNYLLSDSGIKFFTILLTVSLSLHSCLIAFFPNSYLKLTTIQINSIPLFAISLAFAWYRKIKFLFILSVSTTIYSYIYNPQLSTVFVLVPILIAPLIYRKKPNFRWTILLLMILSYFFVAKNTLGNFLLYFMQFNQDNTQIRINMNKVAQSAIDQNLFFGSHLAKPLFLTVTQNNYSRDLPFHSDVTTFSVAIGLIGVFLYLANLAQAFYKRPQNSYQETYLNVARIGLTSYLLTCLFNPVFPGYVLLLVLILPIL